VAAGGGGRYLDGPRTVVNANRWNGVAELLESNLAMIFYCICRMRYNVFPKEIPLPEDERIVCVKCRRELKGKRGTRYFDYEPCEPGPRD
jgi:hypothetical protein